MRQQAHLATHVTLPYEERGAASGVPVVFLHGIMDSARSFEPVLDTLPTTVRAIALTLRGHGDASRPVDGYAIQNLVADVLAFMDAQRIPAAVLVGHSLGSIVARRLAAAHPTRVLGLVLVGTYVTLRGHEEMTALARSVSSLRDPIDRGFVREFQRRTVARVVDEDFLEQVVDESLKVPARVWHLAFRALVDEPSDLATLRDVHVPTRLVWGDQDTIATRADQDALCDAIEGASLIVYSGAGHAPHWEEPARFGQDLLTFVYERH